MRWYSSVRKVASKSVVVKSYSLIARQGQLLASRCCYRVDIAATYFAEISCCHAIKMAVIRLPTV